VQKCTRNASGGVTAFYEPVLMRASRCVTGAFFGWVGGVRSRKFAFLREVSEWFWCRFQNGS